jgi:flavin-dependent dehydrogenase
MAPESYDLIVIGGGPAGSLTASIVKRDNPGRKVLVLEREKFPRHHVGESTIPSWRPILERAGVLEKIEALEPIEKAGGHFWWGMASDRSWTIDFRDPPSYDTRRASFHVDRSTFDEALLDHAASLGADVHEEARVTAVDQPKDGKVRVRWNERGTEHEAIGDYVVDASGQARLLSRLWNLDVHGFDGMNNFAVYGYWKGSAAVSYGPTKARQRWTTIATCPDGWSWHIPIAEDLVSVGVVTEKSRLPGSGDDALEAFYRRNVMECRGIGEQLANAEMVMHPLAPQKLNVVRDWSYYSPVVCGDHFFLVGDAAAFVDPVFSTGLLISSNGAMLTANALNTLWQDPTTDVPLLQQSLRESYRNVATSFHRLASIWYSRNFRYQSLHWEAHRQRLRRGGDPVEEDGAQSFRRLCMGSFADPISGVLYNPARPADFDPYRVEVQIIAEQFFEAPDAHPAGREERDLHAERVNEELRRWRSLLGRRGKVRGAKWRVEERYFTDARSPRWDRVRYIHASAESTTDPFDYVVFPSLTDLPESLLPKLDGTRTLRDTMLDALRGLEAGGSEWQQKLLLFHRLISQLHLRGWLELEGDGTTTDVDWPAPLKSMGELEVACDLIGRSISARSGGRDGFSLVMQPADAPAPSRPSIKLQETTLVLYGAPAQRPMLDRLADAWRAWEATPAAEDFWTRTAIHLAGARIEGRSSGR